MHPDNPCPTPRHRLRLALISIACSLAVLAVVPGTATRQALADAPSATRAEAAEQSSNVEPLSWFTCADVPDAQYAALDVPVDPARPDGPHLTLRLARMPAADTAAGTGPLLFIPGGPGAGVAEAFGAYQAVFRVDELRQDHDVVTFDPRGVGQSSPVRCAPGTVPTPPVAGLGSPAAFDRLAGDNAAFAQSCFEATGALMGHLSAIDTAADIERIRQALGQEDGLVAYAASYGTNYAGAYLEQYGDRVEALVLDAVFDHSVDLPTWASRNAREVEASFGRFAAWCAADSGCTLHGQDTGAVFDAVAAAHPAAVPVVGSLLSAGRDPELGWPAIARLLARAADGDGAALAAAPAVMAAPPDPAVATGRAGLFRGVLCADFGPQGDHAALTRAGHEAVVAAPRFGAWKYWDVVGTCVGWPEPPTNPPHDLRVGPHPNVLVTNNIHDPATPLAAALSVYAQIPEARLLVADSDGHQVLAFSRCGFDAQVRFLAGFSATPRLSICPA